MIALLALLGLLLLPGSAWAHASLRGTDPPIGSRLSAAPRSLRLWFDEPVVAEVSSLRLLHRSGKGVKEGPLKLTDPARKAAEFELGKIEPGAYTAAWKVLSAVDGHVTRGVFAFAYAPPGYEGSVELQGTPAAAGPGQLGWTWGLRGLRVVAVWGHLLALLALTGACLAWLIVVRPALPAEMAPAGSGDPPQPPAPFPPALARLILRGAVVSIAGGVLSLQLEWLQVSEAPLGQTLQLLLFFPAIPVALGTWSSSAAFIRLALLTGVASLATRLPDRDPIALPGILGLGMASLASIAVASHTAAAGGLLWALPDFLHLAAASLWIGGLVLLARLATTPANDHASGLGGMPLREAMRRFTPGAAGSLLALALTGILSGTVQVRSWAALWRTLYGRTLSAKVALLLPLLGLALLNTLWCRGRLARRSPEAGGPAPLLSRAWAWGERRFRGSDWAVRGEVGLAWAVLLLAAALTQFPPPKEGAAGPPPPLVLTGRAEGLALALTLVSPQGPLGPSRVALSVSDARGLPPPPDARVILRPEMLERDVLVLPVTAAPRGDGRYDAELFFSLLGRWDLEVTVRRKGQEDATARFALNLGDFGLAQVDPAAPAGTRLSLMAAWIGRASRRRLLLGAVLAVGGCALAGVGVRRRRWAWPVLAAGLLSLSGYLLWSAMAVDTTPAALRPNPIQPDARSLRAGRALYNEHCAACHGEMGKPSPPRSGPLRPPDAAKLDLTADRLAQHADGDLFWWISRGVPSTPMPAFGGALSEEERWRVVHYIRSLRHPPSGGT